MTVELWTQLKEDARHLHDVGVTSVWNPAGLQGRRTAGRGIRRLRPLRSGRVRPERHRPHQVRHAAGAGGGDRGAARQRDFGLYRHGDEPENRRRLHRKIHGLRSRSRKPRAGDRRPRRSRRLDRIHLPGARRQVLPLQMALVPLLREPIRYTRPANGPSTSSKAKARSGAKGSTARTGTTTS